MTIHPAKILFAFLLSACSFQANTRIYYQQPEERNLQCEAMREEYEDAREWCDSPDDSGISGAARTASCLQAEWFERNCSL